MTPEARWKEISRLYAAALAVPAEERDAFFEAACPDESVRQEVAALLAANADAGTFLDTAAPGQVPDETGVDPSLVGRQLGAYRVDALLGSGGMGEVYRATDTRLHRSVALKILPTPLRDDPRRRELFEDEARAVAALRHPNICVLHDIGRADGVDFLVMELLEGETLAERLSRGPLDREEFFHRAIEIADALVATHDQHIVHGDLKPGNIMLTSAGAKLLDFGLATLHTSPEGGHSTARTGRAFAGTVSYMAPELWQEGVVDHRIDLFAFGAILFEMATATKAVAEPPNRPEPLPPPPTLVERGDADYWGTGPLIAGCLAIDREARFGNTRQIADELRRLQVASSPQPASAVAGWGRPAHLWLTAATLAALVWLTASRAGGMLGSGGERAAALAADPHAPFALGNMRLLTGDDRLEVDPSFSPDGRSIAYAAGSAMQMRVFIRKIDEGTSRPLTPEDGTAQFHPRWSHDGKHILYVTTSGAFVVTMAGGHHAQVDSDADAAGAYSAATPAGARRIFSGAAWSPDDTRIALAYGGSLWIVPAFGDGPRTLVATTPYELHSCDWSPDERWIACVSGNWSFAGPGGYFGNVSPSAIVLLPAGGGQPVEVMDRSFGHRSPSWSADSRRLYFLSNREGTSDLYTVPVAADGTRTGEPFRLTNGLAAYAIAFDPARRHLAYADYSTRSNIWELPVRSTGPIDLAAAKARTRGNQTIEAMRVSRDGRWLLYDSNMRGNFDIYRMDLANGTTTRLTSEPFDEFAPDLLDEGQLLAYHSWQTKSRDVFVRSLTTGQLEQVTNSSSQESLPALAPDGRAIVYLDQQVENGSTRGLFLVRRDSTGRWGSPEHLGTTTSRGAWSSDGRFITYTQRGSIEVQSIDTRQRRVVYQPAAGDPRAGNVQFGPGDAVLYFKSHDVHGQASFWSVPVAGGRPTCLVRFTDPGRPSGRTDFAVGRNHFYFTIDDRRSNIWVADVGAR